MTDEQAYQQFKKDMIEEFENEIGQKTKEDFERFLKQQIGFKKDTIEEIEADILRHLELLGESVSRETMEDLKNE